MGLVCAIPIKRQPGLNDKTFELVFEGNLVVMHLLIFYVFIHGLFVIHRDGKRSVFFFPAFEQRE